MCVLNDFDELPEDFFESCVPCSPPPSSSNHSSGPNTWQDLSRNTIPTPSSSSFYPQYNNLPSSYNPPDYSNPYDFDFSPIPSTHMPTASSSSDLELFNLESSRMNSVNNSVPSVSNLSPNLMPDVPQQDSGPKKSTPRRRTIRKSSSGSTDSSYDYRTMRDKNNIASQRSRQKRREKILENQEEKRRLESRKVELQAQIVALETQVEDYKRMVMMFAKPKK